MEPALERMEPWENLYFACSPITLEPHQVTSTVCMGCVHEVLGGGGVGGSSVWGGVYGGLHA